MNKLPKVDNSLFLPLDSYEKIAKKTIFKYVRIKSLWQDQDFLANIMYEAMKADWVYDESKGTTRETYRIKRCRWAIDSYLYNIKHGKQSFNDNIHSFSDLDRLDENVGTIESAFFSTYSGEKKKDKASNRVKFILDNCDMSKDQKKCIELYYLEGLTIPKIAKQIGKSHQRVQQNIQYAMKQMQVFCGVIDVNS